MMIDNHVHVGWFTDGYHSPKDVWYSEMAAGVDGMAVSSTSTCAELYKVVVREMRELVRLGGNRVHPILWLTPTMLKKRYVLPYMLHSKVKWKGVKMHWETHQEWSHNPKLVEKALDVARKIGCPLLLHTGEDTSCHAGLYIDLIKKLNRIFYKDMETKDYIRDIICQIRTEFPEEAKTILNRSAYE